MTINRNRPHRRASLAALTAIGASAVLLTFSGGAAAAPVAIPLGAADSFAVLAGAGITNTGATAVLGDVGTFPTTTITGVGSMVITGTNHGGDGVTQQAKTDLVTAYNNAVGQGPTTPIAADLGGQILVPGVYNSASSIGLTGTLTLNGGGDPNAVWVFQAGSSLTTAAGSSVSLINGAQSCNVFWQVGSSATLGVGSTFRGTIMALTSITVTTGATIDGRVLARNGSVTLDTNAVTRPICAAAPPATTSPPGTSPPGTTSTTARPTTTTTAPTTTTAAPTVTTTAPPDTTPPTTAVSATTLPVPTTVTPATSPPPGSVGGEVIGVPPGQLPRTGVPVRSLVVLAVVLVLAGVVLTRRSARSGASA